MLDLKIHLNQNLSEELFNIMKRCIEKCSSLPETYLFSACEKHAKDAKEACDPKREPAERQLGLANQVDGA